MKFSAILLSVVVASAAFANADYGPGDFKAKLAGVGVMSADDGAEEPKPLPPATRIIVPPPSRTTSCSCS